MRVIEFCGHARSIVRVVMDVKTTPNMAQRVAVDIGKRPNYAAEFSDIVGVLCGTEVNGLRVSCSTLPEK